MRDKFLLGANKDNEIVFGEFEVTRRNGYPEFSASFDTVRPFNGDNFNLEDYYSDYVDEFDEKTVLNWLKQYDCKPSELGGRLADECTDARDALDCSLYPEEINIDGESWFFESGSCGQHDIRDEMEEIINPEAYELLLKLWDLHHLKQVDDDVIKQVEDLQEALSQVDEEEWIANYIKEHKEDLTEA